MYLLEAQSEVVDGTPKTILWLLWGLRGVMGACGGGGGMPDWRWHDCGGCVECVGVRGGRGHARRCPADDGSDYGGAAVGAPPGQGDSEGWRELGGEVEVAEGSRSLPANLIELRRTREGELGVQLLWRARQPDC